jgi:hypothetical protein
MHTAFAKVKLLRAVRDVRDVRQAGTAAPRTADAA